MLYFLKRCLFALCFVCLDAYASSNKQLNFKVIESAVHQDYIFTQGLHYEDGFITESSGLFKKSFIRIYNPISGDIKLQKRLPSKIFAEGLVKVDKHIYLLTWKAETLFVLNAETLETELTLPYDGDGWGLAHNGEDFIMSNGSNKLYIRDTKTFGIKKTLEVTGHQGRPLRLNELEYADGYIWANSWQDTKIFKIAPNSGNIIGFIELKELVDQNNHSQGHSVLNGIAFDEKDKSFWITGKLWSNLYKIKVEDRLIEGPTSPSKSGFNES